MLIILNKRDMPILMKMQVDGPLHQVARLLGVTALSRSETKEITALPAQFIHVQLENNTMVVVPFNLHS